MKQKKSLRHNKAFKILLSVIYLLGTGAGAVGGYCSLYLNQNGYYTSDVSKLSHNLMNDLCADDMFALNNKFIALKSEGYFDEKTSKQLRQQLYEGFMDGYSGNDTNFFFTIHDMKDTLLLSSYKVTEYQCSQVQVFQETYYEQINLELTEKEMEAFSFPADAVDTMVSSEFIEQEEKPIEVPDMTEVHANGTELQYDEYGAYLEHYDEEGNLFIIRFDENGVPYAIDSYDGSESISEEDANKDAYQYHVSYKLPKTENSYYITGYVRSDLKAHDRYSNVTNTVINRYNYRYAFPISAAVGSFLALVSLLLLVSFAGYGGTRETAAATVFEKIPFDLFTAAIAAAAICSVFALDYIPDGSYSILLCIGGYAVFWSGLLLWWLVSIVMRIRTKIMLSNNLITMFYKWIWRILKKVKQLSGEFFRVLPFIWQSVVAVVVFLIVHLIATVAMTYNFFVGLVFLFPLYGITAVYVTLITWNLHILEQGGRQLAEGNLSEKITESKLTGRFREHAKHLNSIGDGMNKAVSDRLKSEMFRTELISNVSHDIRTPLTSIINYTNLLANLKLENEQANEYITVLKRQSERLHKLTEDVLEASKATTGNIRVNKETMDLRVLLEQMEGEYSERLEEKHLLLIKDIPDIPQYISVDGRLLWRVMDNLFGNICKYAMEGTRVYLNTLTIDGEVICMLRNISGAQLNISSEALMERFVQGDRSRNTEGSGLGLSIAQSLTALQGGSLELQIDGDLFKVTLRFPLADTQDSIT